MKEQLIEIVNAYAAARCSGDGLLQRFAAQQLGAFLERVELVDTTPSPEESNDC
jgi:hypothetical protein